MAGLNHERVVAHGDKGLAEDWNADHKQTGNHDCEKHQHLNHVIENRTDFPVAPVEGQIIYRTDLNQLYVYNGIDWVNLMVLPPIGSVAAWLKSFPNTPALSWGWVECNGQVLSDGDSVYDGETIPDLNGSSGTERFLRGQTSSGGTGGSETHKHTSGPTAEVQSTTPGIKPAKLITDDTSTLPSYYEVVWIMRVK